MPASLNAIHASERPAPKSSGLDLHAFPMNFQSWSYEQECRYDFMPSWYWNRAERRRRYDAYVAACHKDLGAAAPSPQSPNAAE